MDNHNEKTIDQQDRILSSADKVDKTIGNNNREGRSRNLSVE
jgi:hypothetical protein